MKKIVLIISVLALVLVAAKPGEYVELTLVNESGMDIAFQLINTQDETYFYLKIPKGYRDSPTERIFAIPKNTYTATLYYIEMWDPVYGFQCGTSGGQIILNHNIRIVFRPCKQAPANSGENPLYKWPILRFKHRIPAFIPME